MDTQLRTFISYSRADQDFALKLAKALRNEGFNIWLDQLDIPTGEHWDDEVEKALAECEIFMILMTSTSVASHNVKDEVGYAIDHRKEIVPLLLEDCNIPFRLRRLQYVDVKGVDFNTAVRSIMDRLRTVVVDSQHPSNPSGLDWKRNVQAQRLYAPQAGNEKKIALPYTVPSPTGPKTAAVTRPQRKSNAAPLLILFLIVGISVMCGSICMISEGLSFFTAPGGTETAFAALWFTATSNPIPDISGDYISSLTSSCSYKSFFITMTATSSGYTMDWYSVPDHTHMYSSTASFDGQTLEFLTGDANGNLRTESYTLNTDGSFTSFAVLNTPCGTAREIFTPVR